MCYKNNSLRPYHVCFFYLNFQTVQTFRSILTCFFIMYRCKYSSTESVRFIRLKCPYLFIVYWRKYLNISIKNAGIKRFTNNSWEFLDNTDSILNTLHSPYTFKNGHNSPCIKQPYWRWDSLFPNLPTPNQDMPETC